METQIVFPDYCHEDAMRKFVSDMCSFDNSKDINGSGLFMQYQNDFHSWIKKEKQMHLGIQLNDGFVPATTFLYMLDDEVIGVINIRHCLNAYLFNVGGHIGYSVHPQYRKQGHATKMLQAALKFTQEWEITPVLVTCNKDNIASRKTIGKCNGVFENEYKDGEETILRFWIGEKNDRF